MFLCCREFTEFENIGYRNDHWHTVFRSIPENVEDLKNVSIKQGWLPEDIREHGRTRVTSEGKLGLT